MEAGDRKLISYDDLLGADESANPSEARLDDAAGKPAVLATENSVSEEASRYTFDTETNMYYDTVTGTSRENLKNCSTLSF
jgi:hypothetical protein